ncbi:MAG: ABC transporter permease [Saprospiraceae bacterium]|nr:MAG: ABC transporter permease [Saprospiraceae bacterium]
MIVNHLKTAFRYLKNHKFYTLTNFGGLTLGFFCFLLLNFYVSSEQRFDQNHERAYRLLQKIQENTGVQRISAPAGPRVGLTSKEQIPEIEAVSQILELGRVTVGNDPANLNYEHISTINRGFFDVFDFELKEGNPDEIFSTPGGIVLTETLAKKYFGDEPALKKTLRTNRFEGIVVGVLRDFPENSHMQASLMIPTQTAAANFRWWNEFIQTNWHRNTFITYFKLQEGADIAAVEQKINQLAKDNWPQEQEFKSNFTLQPVSDIHLYAGEVEGEINKNKGNNFYVGIFFWMALIILLVACFNYAGLLNVAFMGRFREIGVRKAVGANQPQLLGQFFLESLLLTSFALGTAFLLLNTFQPTTTSLLGKSFDWSYLPATQIGLLALVGLLVSLIAIGYPAWLISKVTTVQALNEEQRSTGRLPIRKVVTFFQFTAAIALIACTLIFYQQLNYLQSKNLGFDKNGIVVVDINSGTLRNQFEAIKSEFGKLPEVQEVSVTSRVPGEWKNFPLANVKTQGMNNEEAKQMIFVGADHDFLNTYGVQLQGGSNFSGAISDSSKVLINQAAIQALGLTDPIGQMIEIPSVNWDGDNNPMETPFRAQVIGIVNDFHFEDFHQQIKPMVIGFWRNPIHNIDYYSIRVNTDDWSTTIASLRAVNDTFDPENPIEYHILNEQFERFYEADIIRSRLLIFFSAIVVLIACLGLFVMTAFALHNRTKEIGIRKVLGATTLQIVKLVTKEFVLLVGIAALIGIPVAWYVMGLWLDEFAYRIELHWWYFALAGIMALVIALFTVSMQSIRAATANPVESLRNE